MATTPKKQARGKKAAKKRPRRGKTAMPFPAAAAPPVTTEGIESYFPSRVKQTLHACSVQERKFVLAYTSTARGNAVLAAQLAGITGSYAARASQGCMMLQKPQVRAAIDAWMEAYALNATQLTAQFKDLTEVNPGPFVERQADGSLLTKVPDDITWEAHKHWVKSILCDPETGRVIKLELHDAMAARRELAKILKLYSDAPILALHLHYQQMSDEELLKQWEEARADGIHAGSSSPHDTPALPAGGPVAVVEG